MLKLQELKENSFPLPTYLDASAPPLEPGWIETPKIAKTTLAPLPKTMIAMDCEMVSSKTTIMFREYCFSWVLSLFYFIFYFFC